MERKDKRVAIYTRVYNVKPMEVNVLTVISKKYTTPVAVEHPTRTIRVKAPKVWPKEKKKTDYSMKKKSYSFSCFLTVSLCF